jgi:hypothetical protein
MLNFRLSLDKCTEHFISNFLLFYMMLSFHFIQDVPWRMFDIPKPVVEIVNSLPEEGSAATEQTEAEPKATA